MNKLLGMVMVFAVAFLGLLPGPAVNKASAAQNFHVQFSGDSAQAVWSTCGFGGPVTGEICTDTYVFATDQATRDRGNKSVYSVLYFDQYSYTLNEEGYYTSVSWRNGSDENAQFSATKKLTSASAAGNVPIQECTVVDQDTWEIECQDAGVLSVETSWTGQGSLIQYKSNSSYRTKDFKSSYSSRSSSRDATATGNIDSVALVNTVYASIYNSRDSSVTICHVFC